ncbi:UNVERIFIED_ORG: DNA-binding transcriptional LysR family regulator [Rhizobium esperanzae]|uniref:HTH-type transcriptional regulator TtuA n=1 Tax=Rhizobium phaseoli TaxID=396 RepID=A0A192TAY6_9HYPH|nr:MULTISPECIES: LysR family transcriptional regulator [Rhizobium]MDH6646903.1 DNA-binding transcriptional LysR family regulator [Rhizobium esperanzae]ANL41298.1 LysR family transcriptional regulator protein [Rhizobium phaseoli]ANL54033.1 LysR family transcriptional regulator protein [Rhizobium phaseoli]ANL60286.1 LysR family transcriptional regulator protein [Rhizobium phaseoli]ANL85679.1 LysR family transcriptional regulator protein [Rhizobium phaseoli]
MARQDINRSGEMEVFVSVVERGGFSAAATARRMTPSAVSKLVARLEARLGVRLVNRSTRKLQLTPEGCAFYERSIAILADIAEAERQASSGEEAAGRIRINTSGSFGNHVLAPLVPAFMALHPAVTLDIAHTDRIVDLMEERADVAIRAGPLKSSSLIARKLGATRKLIVASPDYLGRHGEPRSVADLRRHCRIGFSYARAIEGWPMRESGETVTIPITPGIQVADGEAMRHLALSGAGLARLASFTVRADIDAGRLVPVLEEANPGDIEEFYALYIGQGGPLPARVRALLDFLAAHVRL